MGEGGGRGEDIVAGGFVAICFLIFMFICGIPLLIIGIIFVSILEDYDVFFNTGIIILILSVILIIVGVILTILVCRAKQRQPGHVITSPTASTTTTVVITGPPTQQYPGGAPAYPPQCGAGSYPLAQQYPPAPTYPAPLPSAPPPYSS